MLYHLDPTDGWGVHVDLFNIFMAMDFLKAITNRCSERAFAIMNYF